MLSTTSKQAREIRELERLIDEETRQRDEESLHRENEDAELAERYRRAS